MGGDSGDDGGGGSRMPLTIFRTLMLVLFGVSLRKCLDLMGILEIQGKIIESKINTLRKHAKEKIFK